MRRKTWKFLITFHTTSEAMAVERYCKERKLPGRMIPVPREISASCGLAWCAPAEEKDKLAELLQVFAGELEGSYELEL